MKISSIGFAPISIKNNFQSQIISDNLSKRHYVSFAGENNDAFVPSFSTKKAKVENFALSVQSSYFNTLQEIEKRIDEINNIALEQPHDEEEYKNGKLFKTADLESDDIVEQLKYDENGRKEFKILTHADRQGNMMKVVTYNKDGSERAFASYLNGEMAIFYIDKKYNDIGYVFSADEDWRAGQHQITKLKDSKQTIDFGRYYQNLKDNPYNYTRIECKKDDEMNGSLFISGDENEIWWFDHSDNDKEDFTFKPDEIKGFDMKKMFGEINSLMKKIISSEQRKEEINQFSKEILKQN